MLHDIVKKGSVDRSVTLRIIDSTDGTPETAVVWNTAGIDLWYRREVAAVVSITEATLAALTTAHTDGGFLTISHGYYRLDLPDAAFATGANHVDFGGTVTGMVVIGGRVRLVDYDPEDTVRMGLTTLPSSGTLAVNPILNATQTGVTIPTVTALTGHTAQTGDCFPLVSTEVAEIYAAVITNAAGVDIAADIIAVKADTGNLVTRITATLFSGITSLAEWLGLIAGKQVGNATARTELRATGAGAGAFDETTDSQEAIRDTAPLGTAMRGTDNAALASVCTETRLAELYAANLPADIAAIEAQTDDIGVAGAGLTAVPWNAAWDAEVQSEVVDAISVDAQVELATIPATTAPLNKMIQYIFQYLRNRRSFNKTTGVETLYKEDALTSLGTSTSTDDGITFDKGEVG